MDTKLLFYCSRLLEEYTEENYQLPQEFGINPPVTLVWKTSLAASLYAWSPNEWHFKEYNCSH
jgi:hypothetical protein